MASSGGDGLSRSVAEQVHVVAELRLRNQQLRQRTQAIQQECDAMLKSIAVATAQSQAWISQAGAAASAPPPQPPPPPPPAQTTSKSLGQSFSSDMVSPGGLGSPSLRSPIRAEASVAWSASPVRRGQPAAGVPRFQQHRSPILMQSSEVSVLSVSSGLRPRLPTTGASETMFTSPAGSHFMQPDHGPADGLYGDDGMFTEFEAGELEQMEQQSPARGLTSAALSFASPAAGAVSEAETGAATGAEPLMAPTVAITGTAASASSYSLSPEQEHDFSRSAAQDDEHEQQAHRHGAAVATQPTLSPAGAMLVHRPWKSPARAYESPRRAPGVSFAASPEPRAGSSASPATKSPFATLPPPEQRFSPDSVYYLARVRPERSSLPHNVSPFTSRAKAVNVSPTKASQFKERTPWKSSAEFFHSPSTRSTPAPPASGRKSSSKPSQ